MAALASFALAAMVVLGTPGPTNTMLAASGAAMGIRAAATLPLGEALGYAIAVTRYLTLNRYLDGVHAVLPMLKGIAAVWLLYAAFKLWNQPAVAEAMARTIAWWRVFLTTLLNPKAMLVGAVLIPAMTPDRPGSAALLFVVLSVLAGAAWTAGGALLPGGARPYAYRGGALIVGTFSIAAASSALTG